MTDKLNDNDRQRIEQEMRKYFDEVMFYDEYAQSHFWFAAEYATLYERQQQAQLREENEAKKELVKIYSERVKKYQEEIEEVKKLHELWVDQWRESEKIVEAERTELLAEIERLKKGHENTTGTL